jgi:hypothetical protein
MEFVNDEMKHAPIFFQPFAGLFENRRVSFPHEHDAQHAVVRDEDVGRSVLHIPATAHLTAIQPREKVHGVRIATTSCVCRSRRSRTIHTQKFVAKTLKARAIWIP